MGDRTFQGEPPPLHPDIEAMLKDVAEASARRLRCPTCGTQIPTVCNSTDHAALLKALSNILDAWDAEANGPEWDARFDAAYAEARKLVPAKE